MAIATVLSRAQFGMEAPQVSVEVDIGSGLPSFTIVGLPEAVVKESKDRVRAALLNCNFELPPGRITVNLAPADLPKEGGRFDLPIAVGILVASGQLNAQFLADIELYGELSLSGELRGITGALIAALAATRAGHSVVVPAANSDETRLIAGCQSLTASHLLQVCAHVNGAQALPFADPWIEVGATAQATDLNEVRGQAQAKRALEIAAAGEHSLLFMGPPGTGKSMLAQRLPGILPPLSDDEALQSAAIRSLLGRGIDLQQWRIRPFRAPHHTASAVALVGGGSQPRPGEISLAHNGVLFLDELPEFDRRVLEVLREPLESGVINISRAARQAEFPARFQLIAAMNPCPCGYLGDVTGKCRCTGEQVQRYRLKISGPLLDRLDMHVEVPRVVGEAMQARESVAESNERVASRVLNARTVQWQRQGMSNARLSVAEVERWCTPEPRGQALLMRAMQKFSLSARAYHRILKVARSIADLQGLEQIAQEHVSEAIALRRLDRAQ
ncbi:MAG: YifB family Mg chelatase-like AAA ATPase [Steroidobacteraceae bacterium]